MNPHDLRIRAQKWIDDDVDPDTQRELRALLDAGDLAALGDRFAGPLEFGTAGLRGLLGAGPSRMNRAVVLRTTHGLGRTLLEQVPDVKRRGVVVGYDGRILSRELAEDTACALAALGIPAFLFSTLGPTPLTAFAVVHLGAAAGVMVTASHNPPAYNGYKVYWGNGAQIIPPIDHAIATAIDDAPPARDVPRLAIDAARAQSLVRDVPAEVERTYLDHVHALTGEEACDRALPIVYTPLHGTGDRLVHRALGRAGFTRVTTVPEQREPDGRFPTVAFPNPEEPGAMDLAFALGRQTGAALVLANDPDADRLAVAVRDEASAAGFRQLTGNEVGALLGHHLLTSSQAEGAKRFVLASIVSSPLLGVVAHRLGVHYEETLTGFKWIANRAMQLEAEGRGRFVFGYEEALGYTIGDVVRDKDGISAAVVVAEMAASLAARGETLLSALEGIHRAYGVFVSTQVNATRPGATGAQEIAALMDRLRGAQPRAFGSFGVVAVRDYQASTRLVLASGATTHLTLPPSNVLTFELEGGSRVIARPSGTEPKIKFYVDVREPIAEGEPVEVAEARARTAMEDLTRVFTALAHGEGEQGNRR